ncbi:MAG: GGDEF domain-containing protein [Burkholderiaceae bacterium]|nr:GGDEF domain-containing protein [Burkholderiaceae bacterium]
MSSSSIQSDTPLDAPLPPAKPVRALGWRLGLVVLLTCSLAVGLTEWLNLPAGHAMGWTQTLPSTPQALPGQARAGTQELLFEPSSAGAADLQAAPPPQPSLQWLARDLGLVLLLSLALHGVLRRMLLRPMQALDGQAHSLSQDLLAERQRNALLRQQTEQQHDALLQARQAHAATTRELSELSRVDALTGLPNRREFEEALRREFKRAQRQRGGLALAVLDLDRFKNFNERYGQAAGDAALQRFASLLAERFKRDTDLVARLGGEEFVALLPGFEPQAGQQLLEQLREDLRALQITHAGGVNESLTLSVSVGLAAYSPQQPYLSSQALMQAADEALYLAKHTGRDRLSRAALSAASPRPAQADLAGRKV